VTTWLLNFLYELKYDVIHFELSYCDSLGPIERLVIRTSPYREKQRILDKQDCPESERLSMQLENGKIFCVDVVFVPSFLTDHCFTIISRLSFDLDEQNVVLVKCAVSICILDKRFSRAWICKMSC